MVLCEEFIKSVWVERYYLSENDIVSTQGYKSVLQKVMVI